MLSKNVIKKAAGVARDQYLDVIYNSLITQTKEYGVDNEKRLISFLSQVGAETNGFFWLEELSSGQQYEGRSDLGNINIGDGTLFKGRGLIQLTGRNNYRKASNFLQTDFENDPENVSPTNQDHKNLQGTTTQYNNAVKSALFFWRKGSAWGDLNTYADLIDFDAPLNLGNLSLNALPKSNSQARSAPFNLRPKKGNNNPFEYKGFFLVDYLGLDRQTNGRNLFMLELLSVGVNGGYNGFRERVENFERGRNELQNNDYREPIQNSAQNNTPSSVLEQEISSNPIEQENNKSPDKNLPPTKGIRTIKKPNVELNPITFDVSNLNKEALDNIGQLPFVYFNGVQLDILEEFEIASKGFLPTIRLTFKDSYGKISSTRYPTDDNKVKVLISPRSSVLRPIFMEFKVIDIHKLEDNDYELSGVININPLLLQNTETFPNATSFDVMKKMSDISGLGFKSNVNDSDDKMTWVNISHTKRYEFIKKVLEHSYISDSSFVWAYVDFYYYLNYLDLEKQINQNVEKQKGVISPGMDRISQLLGKSSQISTSALYLTNDRHASSSTNFYESAKVINSSTKISIREGYMSIMGYYDSDNRNMYRFNIDALETPGNLPLRSNDDAFFNNNNSKVYKGRLIGDNVHKNYHYAQEQNKGNLDELQKIGLVLTLPNPNFNLYRFQKIYNLYINEGISYKNHREVLNRRISGYYIISEISFFIENNILKQKIKIVRRDLGFSEEESPI